MTTPTLLVTLGNLFLLNAFLKKGFEAFEAPLVLFLERLRPVVRPLVDISREMKRMAAKQRTMASRLQFKQHNHAPLRELGTNQMIKSDCPAMDVDKYKVIYKRITDLIYRLFWSAGHVKHVVERGHFLHRVVDCQQQNLKPKDSPATALEFILVIKSIAILSQSIS